MTESKIFSNGFKVILNKAEGFTSCSAGIIVNTGSVNENNENNGISHFIEHTVFKGTKNRTAFQISDFIDRIGAQINAFTSKEITCYYTKSTKDHLEESLEVLSDILFNAVFDEEELKKEKGVIIEEINMADDTPEDVCADLLAESYYGKTGYGRTILGPSKNIQRFSEKDVRAYMDDYYTADNMVLSISGNIDMEKTFDLAEKYFATKFTKLKSKKPDVKHEFFTDSKFTYKDINQAHIGIAMPSFSFSDDKVDAYSVAISAFGGGMSSRLFQKVREEMGLAYNVYAYSSLHKDEGVTVIGAGVNEKLREEAFDAIINETKKFVKEKITEDEFLRSKEQYKSSYLFGQESTASLMLLYGKYFIFKNAVFDMDEKLKDIEKMTINDVNDTIDMAFDIKRAALSTVGKNKSSLIIK